jgi:predicted HTH domain antitoxin
LSVIPEEVKRKCIKLSETMTAREIYTQYYSKNYDVSFEGFRGMLKKWKRKDREINPTHITAIKETKKEFNIIETLKKGISINELAEQLNISLKTCESVLEDIKGQGYNILRLDDEVKISNLVIPTDNYFENAWNGEKIIRFGLMGDTQINSKYTQITHLHKFYDICKSEGIADIYHTGDIDEGEQMRPGHQYECYNQGADDHVNEIVRVYPKREGITTHFITGNHDASIIKRCGYDIGYPISNQRDDMIYLGQSDAVINLTPNCNLELRHPLDGTAYALSYKIQKLVESMSGGEKPNILAVGHYHKSEYLFYRNVHCFQSSSFQAQTPWLKGKGISVAIGGWIVEVNVDSEGTITRVRQEYIPFYKAIYEDYKNWMK